MSSVLPGMVPLLLQALMFDRLMLLMLQQSGVTAKLSTPMCALLPLPAPVLMLNKKQTCWAGKTGTARVAVLLVITGGTILAPVALVWAVTAEPVTAA